MIKDASMKKTCQLKQAKGYTLLGYTFMVYSGFGGNCGEKMDMEPPYKTTLYINNLSATHSPEENLAWGS